MKEEVDDESWRGLSAGRTVHLSFVHEGGRSTSWEDDRAGRLDDCSRLFGSHPWVLTARCFVGIRHRYLIGCLRHFSYGIRISEVRILSPTPATIIVGLTASPSVM